jgi:Bacteriophage HK97-gp10, putative tail-component
MPRTQRATVAVDTSQFTRDMRTLTTGLKEGSDTVAHQQAGRTADKTRANTPVRTGTLQSTVGVTPSMGGWGVTYGGGLPYAGYIERKRHPVRKGARGARTEFTRALGEMTGRVARGI